MGFFDMITPPSWEGSKTAPTTQKQTLNYNPYQVQPGQPVKMDWNPYQVQPGQPLASQWQAYDPQQVQSSWNPAAQTAYSGAEQGAIAQLAGIIQQGGYSPEQKQTMYGGMMAPVYQQGEEARRAAEADAYRRGLGQSSVLSRSYGDIDKQLMASGQQAMGQIEQQSAGMVLPAIGAIQQGQQNLLGLTQQQAEANARLAMEREGLATQESIAGGGFETSLAQTGAQNEIARQQIAANLSMTEGELQTSVAKMNAELALSRQELSAKLNMHENDLKVAMNQINATLEMSDADRQVQLQQIMNQFNLDAAQMEMLQQEAKKDRWSSFFSNLLGGGAEILGGALGIKK